MRSGCADRGLLLRPAPGTGGAQSGVSARPRAPRSALPSLGPSPGRSSWRSDPQQLVVVIKCRLGRAERDQPLGKILDRRWRWAVDAAGQDTDRAAVVRAGG